MSTWPNSASAASLTRCTSSSFETSAGATSALTPSASTSVLSWFRSDSVRATSTTCTPSRASARAAARPIPRLAPVMTATFPLSSLDIEDTSRHTRGMHQWLGRCTAHLNKYTLWGSFRTSKRYTRISTPNPAARSDTAYPASCDRKGFDSIKIAFYGDSLTAGIPGVSYFNILRQRLPEHELLNFGQPDDT